MTDLLKKYWYVTLLLIGTAGLGLATLFISLRLQQQAAINPPPPKAATEACTLTFTIATPSATPTNTPPPNYVTIGDFVWNDTDHDGIQDNGEPGIPGVTVNLYTGSGTLVTTTTTDANGNYIFSVPAGSYFVEFINPGGYTFSTPYEGSNTAIDSNASAGGRSEIITLTAGQSNLTIDAGLYTPQSPTPSNTPTPTRTPTPTLTPSPTNTPIPGSCNATCSVNSDCGNNMICSSGHCRNQQCTEQPNCACYFVPTPKVPVTGTGTTIAGIAVIAGGIFLLLLGLSF